jgi:hypothetical protein
LLFTFFIFAEEKKRKKNLRLFTSNSKRGSKQPEFYINNTFPNFLLTFAVILLQKVFTALIYFIFPFNLTTSRTAIKLSPSLPITATETRLVDSLFDRRGFPPWLS